MNSFHSNTEHYERYSHVGRHHYPPYFKGNPTIFPIYPFDPVEDAENLEKSMKGFGTDENKILNILTKRSKYQRLEIIEHFQNTYGKDLIQNLKSELSGHFEDVIIAMMTPLQQYYVNELHRAVNGLGTDEDILIEILCTLPNEEMKNIRHLYYETYGKTLEHDLNDDTSGTFKNLLISLSNKDRNENMEINHQEALFDAEQLINSNDFSLKTEKSIFTTILTERNFIQLRLIFDKYQELTGNDIEYTIKKEFSGDTERCMLAIVHAIKNKNGYFAECLHNYMKGLGTHDKNLIRVIVTRSEIDLEDIKKEFHSIYGVSLKDKVNNECSGDYKRCLDGLISQ